MDVQNTVGVIIMILAVIALDLALAVEVKPLIDEGKLQT